MLTYAEDLAPVWPVDNTISLFINPISLYEAFGDPHIHRPNDQRDPHIQRHNGHNIEPYSTKLSKAE